MDRGSGTLSTQMADFVIVCITGNTRVPAQRRVRKVRSRADCPSLRLSSVYLHYLSSYLLLFSIHLLKNTFPYVTEQDNLFAFFCGTEFHIYSSGFQILIYTMRNSGTLIVPQKFHS